MVQFQYDGWHDCTNFCLKDEIKPYPRKLHYLLLIQWPSIADSKAQVRELAYYYLESDH